MSNKTEVITATSPVLDQFINKSIEYLSSAEAFLKAEVPAFIQELLAWKFYEATVSIVIMSVIISIVGFVFIKSFLANQAYKKSNRYNENSDGYFAAMAISGVLGFVLILFLACPIGTMIKIKVAPRVFLLEQVRNLVK